MCEQLARIDALIRALGMNPSSASSTPVVSSSSSRIDSIELFGRCIEAIKRHPPEVSYEVIVVVNGDLLPCTNRPVPGAPP